MADRGPARQPKSLKILNGNLGKRNLDYEEAEADGNPQILGPLNDDGLEHWDLITRHAADWGIGIIDSHPLYAMCRWWEEYRKADRELANCAPEDLQKNMNLTQTAFKNWTSMAIKYGLSPADRTKIRLENSSDKKDPLDQLLEKANK